jgi:hypothetical protein
VSFNERLSTFQKAIVPSSAVSPKRPNRSPSDTAPLPQRLRDKRKSHNVSKRTDVVVCLRMSPSETVVQEL